MAICTRIARIQGHRSTDAGDGEGELGIDRPPGKRIGIRPGPEDIRPTAKISGVRRLPGDGCLELFHPATEFWCQIFSDEKGGAQREARIVDRIATSAARGSPQE
jgi:hypothetical protein